MMNFTRDFQVLVLAIFGLGAAFAADSVGYRKSYFAATVTGAWAEYSMKVEGQSDLRYRSTRLADDGGRPRVNVQTEYVVAGKPSSATTAYLLQAGYSLESDALGYGKAVTSITTSTPGTTPFPLPSVAVDNARRTMPDYAASAQFVASETVAGKPSDRYRYQQRHPGNPETIETGEIWLNGTVPFGMVKQVATTKEVSGKTISKFEMLLVNSGVDGSIVQAGTRTSAKKPVAEELVPLGQAFVAGRVALEVSVVPGSSRGQRVMIEFRNKGTTPLRLRLPSGQTVLDVGLPIDKFQLYSSEERLIELQPGATSAAIELTQTGKRRAVEGKFSLSVYEGTPLFSGSAKVDTVSAP